MQSECLRSELIEVPGGPEGPLRTLERYIEGIEAGGERPLRCGLVASNGTQLTLEVCKVMQEPRMGCPKLGAAVSGSGKLTVAMVVPTGVGASIGGFIGDASPVARALEAVADKVILNPNVVNGADLYGGGRRSVYVDGYTLDEFFAERVLLTPGRRRRIGLVIDHMEESQRTLTLNAANACCAVWGIDMVGYTECGEPVRGRVHCTKMRHFIGELENPTVLFNATERLLGAGADAIAVVTATGGISPRHWHDHYFDSGVNPVGALEALISRAITWKMGIACAHAPAFVTGMAEGDRVVDPRAAAELVARTGLPCVLKGLANAANGSRESGISVRDLSAVIVPVDCAGGMPALAARRLRIPLIAVRENKCVVGVSAEKLGEKEVIVVDSYAEEIAYLVSLRAGIAWSALRGQVQKLQAI